VHLRARGDLFTEVFPVEGSEEDGEFLPVEDEELADTLFEIINSEMEDEE